MRGIPGTLSSASASPRKRRYGSTCFMPPRSFCCAAIRLFSTTFLAFGDGGATRGLQITSRMCFSNSSGYAYSLSTEMLYAASLLRLSRFDRLGEDVRDEDMEEKDVRLSRSRMFSWVSGKTRFGSNERDGVRGAARRFAGRSCDVLYAQLSERARFLRMNGSTCVIVCNLECNR